MTWRRRLVRWLAEILPRGLAVWLGIRRLTPVDIPTAPWRSFTVAALDTGGGFRANHRMQDPAKDPDEPKGGEGSGRGTDHGWSNCTMASAATAGQYEHPHGGWKPWGGELRHRQGDLDGGTDLYDARAAWADAGHELKIRSGDGWAAMIDALDAGRAVVIQGIGNVPGAADFDGGHACVIAPERRDEELLFGDPLCSDWQWVPKSRVREWAEAWDSGISFAVGSKPPEEPDPEPEPEPPPEPEPEPVPAPSYADGYAAGERDGRHREYDRVFASWGPGRPWVPPDEIAGAVWDWSEWDGPTPAPVWAPGWPLPLLSVYRAQTPAAWGQSGWASAVWR